jgi:hypothetical protein
MERSWNGVIAAAARREPVDAFALPLAQEILTSRAVVLAMQVIASGPQATTAAIELADLLFKANEKTIARAPAAPAPPPKAATGRRRRCSV